MPDYFFDTSVLIAYFKREDPRTLTMLADVIAARATAAISAMTIAELWAAPEMANPTRQAERLAVVSMLQIVAVDQAIAQRGGTIRRDHGLRIADATIAATAQQTGGRFMSKDAHLQRLISAQVLIGEVYG